MNSDTFTWSLAFVLTLVAAAPSAGAHPARAVPGRADVITLQWPDHRVQRDIIAYEATSLLPIAPSATRPTLDQRLAQPPFVTGEGRVGIDLARLDAAAALALRSAAASAGSGASLNFSGFAPVGERLYGPRRAPGTLDALYRKHGLLVGRDWVSVDLDSLLVHGKRRIWFDARRILEGSVAALEGGSPRVVYPSGTWFVAEQFRADGSLMETHIIGKRVDQDWDFLLYDARGSLVSSSAELGMRAPTNCFACHRNMGRMSPFREFPDASPADGAFQPAVLLSLTAADSAVVRAFAVSGARPDELHGVYGGIAALKVRAWIAAGDAPDWARSLWPRLVKVVPALSTR